MDIVIYQMIAFLFSNGTISEKEKEIVKRHWDNAGIEIPDYSPEQRRNIIGGLEKSFKNFESQYNAVKKDKREGWLRYIRMQREGFLADLWIGLDLECLEKDMEDQERIKLAFVATFIAYILLPEVARV